jgi:hypothetical protein
LGVQVQVDWELSYGGVKTKAVGNTGRILEFSSIGVQVKLRLGVQVRVDYQLHYGGVENHT